MERSVMKRSEMEVFWILLVIVTCHIVGVERSGTEWNGVERSVLMNQLKRDKIKHARTITIELKEQRLIKNTEE